MEKTIEERRLEFLDEISGHYNLGNRATLGGDCVYIKTPTSRGCAIGAACPPDVQERLAGITDVVTESRVQDILPKELKELGMDFLVDCQVLHDNRNNWTARGLSEYGMESYNRIKSNYCTV